jgi:hypothetical protein
MKLSTTRGAESSASGKRPQIPDRPPAPTGDIDPRMVAFGDLLLAADSGNDRGVLAAARRLRALDFSIVLLSPRGQGGRR